MSVGSLGLVLDGAVADGERYWIVLEFVPGEAPKLVEAEAAWCSGVRAEFRWVGLAEAEEARLRAQVRQWLDSGGRWLELRCTSGCADALPAARDGDYGGGTSQRD